MPRSGRSALALVVSLLLLAPGLSACGDDEAVSNSGKVTVTGDVGKAPTVTFDGQVTRTTTDSDVIVEGKGEEVQDGDTLFLHYYIGNGYTKEKAISTWDQQEGGPAPAPQFTPMGDQTWPAVRNALKGTKVGSRVLILSTAKDSFEDNGAPGIGLGNQDSVVWVVDVVSKALDAPEGAKKPVPAGMPTVVETDGKVTALDFSKAGPTPTAMQVVTLVEGTGPAVRQGAQVAVRYLGQTWKGAKPFDQNYTAPFPGFPGQNGQIDPATFGVGNYVKGWDEQVPGLKVGSRVLLIVPPAQGYGAEAKGDIPPNSTLVFVVDLLGQG